VYNHLASTKNLFISDGHREHYKCRVTRPVFTRLWRARIHASDLPHSLRVLRVQKFISLWW